MKSCSILLFILLSLSQVNAQNREDLTAEANLAFSSSTSKNLVLLIGSDHVTRAIESAEKERANAAPGLIKYAGIQYLYLQNVTVFSGPVSRKSPVEIISQTANKLVFKIPQIRQNVLEIDLGSVVESVNKIGVQIATISFQ
jgi:hypothetical protein